MHPVLFEIPDAFRLSPGVLAAEIFVGVACLLVWSAMRARGRKDWVAGAFNLGAFLVGLHLVLSWLMDGEITIYSFGVIIVLAFFAGAWFLTLQTRKLGLPDKKVYDFAFWMLIVGIAGARVLYAILNWEEFSEEKGKIFMIWHGGLVWYGGLIPAILVGLWLVRRYKLPLLLTGDAAVVAVMLSLGIGRWACFFAGDDYGRPAPDLPWSISFTAERTLVPHELRGVPLHPTQLYMSVGALWLFFTLEWIRRRGRFAGQAFGWMLILYAVFRGALIEPLRGDFVERNPGYAKHLAATLTVRKGEGTDAVKELKAGTRVEGDPVDAELLEPLALPAGEATATVRVISTAEVAGGKDPFRSPPTWRAARIDGLPPGATVDTSRVRWYGSDLPVPPGYVSTSQWLGILILAAGAAVLAIAHRLRVPGFREAVAASGEQP